jgi:uncharacterized sulfatase
LRGEKGTLYEGGIREPLIVRWPGVVEPGTVCKTPVTSVDFYPTFLDMVGLNQPDDHILDGLSIMPLLTQKSNDMNKRAIYWHYPVYHHSTPASAIREGAWKLVEFFQDGQLELYNLEKDVSESKNLVDEMPEKARELHQKLQSWRESVNARSPEENPDFDPDKRLEWGTHPDRR